MFREVLQLRLKHSILQLARKPLGDFESGEAWVLSLLAIQWFRTMPQFAEELWLP